MPGNTKTIWVALASNAAILVAKTIGAVAGGSSSLAAEALHSLADTADSVMLIVGTHRAAKPADPTHPFGHGKELYFWTMVVAVSIFAIGGCASVIEGVVHILHPSRIEDPLWTYVVLGLAGLFEGSSMIYAWRQFWKQKGKGRGVLEGIHKAKDPTTFLVVLEDTAAVAGVAIALTAVWLEHLLRIAWLDGVGAVCVGLVMASVAVFLIQEVQALLVGERVVPEKLDALEQLVRSDPDVAAAERPRTMHFGPETVMVAVRARFKEGLSGEEIVGAIERLRGRMCAEYEEVKYLYVEPIGREKSAGERKGVESHA